MSGSEGKFTTRKGRALQALIQGKTVEVASQESGVSERTVYRWLQSPDFKAELKRLELQVVESVGRRLVSMSNQALDSLVDVMDCPQARGQNIRRLAAVSVLELLLKWRDKVDWESRLQAVEERVFQD